MKNKSVLLIISGGIAAYKTLELIRLLKKAGAQVRCILTAGGAQFVTPLSVSALSENPCYTDLFSLKDEAEMGHIRLTREADLIVVAPASANMLAKMAHGLADNLATTTLLATDQNTPVFVAPAMNPEMWGHRATQENVETLKKRGVRFIGPVAGEAACGETGMGRMAEPTEIFAQLDTQKDKPLAGKTALVTAGPTYEPLDPVRFIGNRSSGKQGYAIAQALHDAGAAVTLVTGPTALPAPGNINTIRIETATEMLDSCQKSLPVDIVVCAAAVADFTPTTTYGQKIKKDKNKKPEAIELKENPDILQILSRPGPRRPSLVIGFAAETENLLDNARAKRLKKGCDWILANDVAAENVFGADENHVYLITSSGTQEWQKTTKRGIAQKLVAALTDFINEEKNDQPDRNRTDAA